MLFAESRMWNVGCEYSEDDGEGCYNCALTNCIVYFNASGGANDNVSESDLSYCCTTPDPGGVENIIGNPLFVDMAAGTYRLQKNSPCIDAGCNFAVPKGVDLDGQTRIMDGDGDSFAIVDMGCYESPTVIASGTVLIMR